MALRGRKPKAVDKRLKALFFGPAGVGKTTAAIQFPQPYLIDTERGAENTQYVAALEKSGGALFQTTDYHEMVQEVRALLTEKHKFRTLVIDPVTVLYDHLVEEAERVHGNEWGRHYGEANKHMKRLYALLLKLDMNVILTCHAKNEYRDGELVGNTFDGWKKLDYMVDLAVELRREGERRLGVVRKSRIEGFPELEVFPWSYDEIASRYGGKILEKGATPVKMATPQQAAELERLLELLRWPENSENGRTGWRKWLQKADAHEWTDMACEQIQACLDYLHQQLKHEEVS